jgi:Formin Homology 2 Domain
MPKLLTYWEDIKIVKEVTEEKKVVITIVSLIDDDKRVQLLNLAVKKYTDMAKISYPDLRQMILSLDDSALGFDSFCNLKSIAPTKEEITKVASFKGDVESLDMPSRWVWEMKDVPNFAARLDFFGFIRDYEGDFKCSSD